jgi:hypothetical protein
MGAKGAAFIAFEQEYSVVLNLNRAAMQLVVHGATAAAVDAAVNKLNAIIRDITDCVELVSLDNYKHLIGAILANQAESLKAIQKVS